jgi:subtilase family protein
MAQSGQRHRWRYRPGEMVVAVHLAEDTAQPDHAHAAAREVLEEHLAGRTGGLFSSRQRRQAPVVFRAEGRPPLAFLFFDLEQADHADVKKAVHDVQAAATLDRLRARGLAPLGVMPHWLGSALQDYSGGSPATLPRPAQPRGSRSRWRRRYTAADRGLDFRPRLLRGRSLSPVSVLILDTPPDWGRAQRQSRRFANVNAQLPELLEFLGDTSLPEWHAQALLDLERSGLKMARTADGRNRKHDVSDHALFIAGLIHDLAPTSRISLRPVLNRFGAGDLHLLLQVLADVTRKKPRGEPLVINMSLGYTPRLEYLPWVWYGVPRRHDPDFLPDVGIRDEARDQQWLVSNRAEVNRTRGLLQGGLDELGGYLLANNCFGVAAAGNDSLTRVERGGPRFGPRYPARDEAILGVAATVEDPTVAPAYSNVGEDIEIGDHIATFGGDMRATDTPRRGVIGVFTAQTFPRATGESSADLTNQNGWAEWSGTSFATAIASGLAAGYWTIERAKRPDLSAGTVLSEFHRLAPHYAPAVRTPSIAIKGEWEAVR